MTLKEGESTGSGFVVHEDGIVVTNHHVMDGAIKATVLFANDLELPVEGHYVMDKGHDVAVIKVDTGGKKLPAVDLASRSPRKGEKVVAFGAPVGLSFSSTNGIVSAVRSESDMANSFGKDKFLGTWVQTNAPISPGNSGGPLVNMYGEVVAANTITITTGQKLNFGISSLDISKAVAGRSPNLTKLDQLAKVTTVAAASNDKKVEFVDSGLPQVDEATRKKFDELVEVVEPAVVRINVLMNTGGKGGSGFVVHEDGIIITYYHVISEGVKSSVVFANDEAFNVTGFLAVDLARNVAVIQIDGKGKKFPVVKLSNKLPRKGDRVINFGTPLGLDFTTSDGIVSAVRSQEEMAEVAGITNLKGTWIQSDAAISSGSSGGPMVNMYGEVVAANTMHRTDGQSLNFGISGIDINSVVAGRTKTPKEISEKNLPKFRQEYASPGGSNKIDAVGTERGNKLLSEMKEITFVVAANAIDPTGRIAFF